METKLNPTAKLLFLVIVLAIGAITHPSFFCTTATDCGNYPYVVSAINALFGVICLLVAYAAYRPARATRSRMLLARACAFTALGIFSLGPITRLALGLGWNLNFSVFSLSIDMLIGSLLLALGQIIPEKKIRGPGRAILITTAMSLALMIASVVFESSTPTFSVASARTPLAILIYLVTGGLLLPISINRFFAYRRSRSLFDLWFFAGDILFCASVFVLLTGNNPLDTSAWLARELRLACAVAFLWSMMLHNTVAENITHIKRVTKLFFYFTLVVTALTAHPAIWCGNATGCPLFNLIVGAVNGPFGIALLIFAYATIENSIVTRSRRVMLTMAAFAWMGTLAVLNGFGRLLPQYMTTNMAVMTMCLGALGAAAALTFAHAAPDKKTTINPRTVALIVLLCAIVLTVLYAAYPPQLPVFNDAQGRTMLAKALFGIAGAGFAFVSVRYYLLYRDTRHTITKWMAIGTALLSIAAFTIIIGTTTTDLMSVLTRLLRLLGALAFLRAITLLN